MVTSVLMVIFIVSKETIGKVIEKMRNVDQDTNCYICGNMFELKFSMYNFLCYFYLI